MQKIIYLFILGIISIAMFSYFITPKKSQILDSTKFSEEKLRFFDWSQTDEIELSNVYENIEFLPVLINYDPRGISSSNDKLFIHSFPNDNFIRIYDLNNQSLINVIDLSKKVSSPIQAVANEAEEVIFIGDSENKKIVKIDYKGKIIQEYNIGFHFIDFNYSSYFKRFVFYSPMYSLHSKSDEAYSILITNEKAEILHEMFPIDNLCFEYNSLASNRFNGFGEKTFFSPPLSGTIYELFYDGSIKKVFELPVTNQQKQEIKEKIHRIVDDDDELIISEALSINKKLPIIKYLVNNNFITIEKYFNEKQHIIIIERQSGKSIAISPKIKFTNFGQDFKFVFSKPKFSSSKGFISFTTNQLNITLGKELKNYEEAIPLYLSEAIKKQNDLIMFYDYDFNFLYKHSSEDLRYLITNSIDNNNILLSEDVKIFPNPANDDLDIRFFLKSDRETDVVVSLLNIWGSTVEQKKIKGATNRYFSTSFNVKRYSPGNYFVLIELFGGKTITKQVVIK